MSYNYTLIEGNSPLLISMPHNGQFIPEDIAQNMTNEAKLIRDTDWYKDKLYDFAHELGASILAPKCSRYVIDLNRNPSGENLYPGANSTELCPTTAFNLEPLYLSGKEPNEQEVARRVEQYWQPYHQALSTRLSQIKQMHGCAVLLEAHSILSHVPRFFEGQLPDFNFGTADGKSCDASLLEQIKDIEFSPYTQVANGRFKGGYITRAYGHPEQNIHAIQLELSQITYMNEAELTYNETLAEQVKPKLKAIVETLIAFGNQHSTQG